MNAVGGMSGGLCCSVGYRRLVQGVSTQYSRCHDDRTALLCGRSFIAIHISLPSYRCESEWLPFSQVMDG